MSIENTTPDTGPVQAPVPPAPAVSSEDKTVAIVSYLTLIGFIVAIILHGNKKTRLGAFHLRQVLILIIASIAVSFVLGIFLVIPLVNFIAIFAGIIVYLGFFVIWILGLVAAINGQQKPLPVIGKYADKWFPILFS
ncbi:MAG: hypothetical protein LBK99_17665 [Opitutaceae bacterium]|jgi:uncharacterized membrane protein|nr:hypothetical protein [Opitutaceae bacterium]